MILIDNRDVLRMKDRDLLNRMIEVEKEEPTGTVIVERAKTGVPTLKMVVEGKIQYIHSKYDPEKEANRLIENFSAETRHVLFIGAGMGFHIKAFMATYPNTKFSVYEPNEEVLLSFLTNVQLNELPLQKLVRIFTGLSEEAIMTGLHDVLQSANGMLQIFTLPMYEKVYEKQIAHITKSMVEVLKHKRLNLATTKSNQKRWIVNSMKNFPVLLKTPNILHDVSREFFCNKPAIIVAAGPSLNEEYDNLRYIKENKLAYIFSVGSAINSIIEQGIYPDATCSMDPKEKNQDVISKVKDRNIKDIPLVFGSSIGFETLESYPGEMFHMITSADKISLQLLDTNRSIDIVWDAPTVAAVTLQLLCQLECNPIILVGQNLAYQDHKRYAEGIEYDFISSEVKSEEMEKAVTVKNVYGDDIQTNISFNSMRRQLEAYVKIYRDIEVINTTKGGAQIAGTSFIELEKVLENRLRTKVVDLNWTKASNSYDKAYIRKKIVDISRSEEKCKEIVEDALEKIKKVEVLIKNRQIKKIEILFAAFDSDFNKLKANIYYQGFIEPMLKVQNEKLAEESQFIRYESDTLKKAESVVKYFGSFFIEVNAHIEFAKPYFEEMKEGLTNV
ncbi:motility associated factor glycosyltransferase family protein [Sporosarcina newyorkensis]|uniref:motility associated factor glycosyltransferase family protein n=1 Tax=Sporosarcina newyorkensis TaxID=759851 RepID=UPI003D085C18